MPKIIHYFRAMQREKRIMGIDPGTNILGYGVVQVQGKKVEALTHGVIMLNKLTEHTDKLKAIFEKSLRIIDEYLPDEMAVEAPFFGKNVQSMLKLGRAQGVVMAAALYRNIPIVEYSPRKVKQSVTGSGSASKEQVAHMLESVLNTKLEARYADATDGLAVALCHHFQSSSPIAKSSGSWDQFLKNNPDRIA